MYRHLHLFLYLLNATTVVRFVFFLLFLLLFCFFFLLVNFLTNWSSMESIVSMQMLKCLFGVCIKLHVCVSTSIYTNISFVYFLCANFSCAFELFLVLSTAGNFEFLLAFLLFVCILCKGVTLWLLYLTLYAFSVIFMHFHLLIFAFVWDNRFISFIDGVASVWW